ncbi:MAG: respiratory-chain dehydrogenase subunit 1 [Gemmataceae bacterium]|nr:respiratory-chain dehydrogenase subunit 1 [Gemmataceae bacterium]
MTIGGAVSFAHVALALVLAPFLLSVINRTKAAYAGRRGQPWLQPYYDLGRLLRKGAVYSRTTTWVFRAGPIVGLAAVGTALLMLPFGRAPAVISFQGDFILFVYLLGTARLFLVLAALDTGSAFEGMGANREVLYSALAEPAVMLGLAALAKRLADPAVPGLLSLSALHAAMTADVWAAAGLVVPLVAVAWWVVLLAETSRIPVDDPTTHLELTMIHEVMVLDHSGPDFAYITYTAALKVWLFGGLLVGLLFPLGVGVPGLDTLIGVAAMLGVAVAVGVVEATIARLQLPRVPQLLVGATALAALAFVLDQGGAR